MNGRDFAVVVRIVGFIASCCIYLEWLLALLWPSSCVVVDIFGTSKLVWKMNRLVLVDEYELPCMHRTSYGTYNGANKPPWWKLLMLWHLSRGHVVVVVGWDGNSVVCVNLGLGVLVCHYWRSRDVSGDY